MVFEHAVFRHAEATEQRLILYSPTCEHDTHDKMVRPLAGAPEAAEPVGVS